VRSFLTVLGVLALVTAPAHAHELLLRSRVDGSRLRVEAYYKLYNDESPAEQVAIILENEKNEVVAKGKTDDNGTWSCALPAPGTYLLKAQSVGHAATKSLAIGGAAPPRHAPDEGPETPWLKVLIGFGVIAVLFALIWLTRRSSSTRISQTP
jgi:uncharacterized GH25 family protein